MATILLDEGDKYSVLFEKIVRWTGLVLPWLVIVYGLFVDRGLLEHSPIFSEHSFLMLSVIFLGMGLYQFFNNKLQPAKIIVYLIAYHLLAASYLVWVAGFDSPLVFLWLILIVVSDLYFGRQAVIMSTVGLCITGLFAFLTLPPTVVGNGWRYTSLVVIIGATGLIVSMLRKVHISEHQDLQKARADQLEQREQLVTLINSINLGVMSTTGTGMVRIYNAALLDMLDTNQSLSGKKVDDIFSLVNEKGEPVKLSELKPTGLHEENDQCTLRYEDGDTVRLGISISPIQGRYSTANASSLGFIYVIRDITKAKNLDEERDEFISVISHELRTPITITEGTISNAQLFLERGATADKLKPALKEAHEQVVFLANMVNDLGTLSRADRGVGDAHEEIDVTELANELFHKYSARAEQKGLTFNLDASGHLGKITSSRLYLEEILQNFITNAIKYTVEGTVVLGIKHSKDGVYFSVTDSGIGISKSDQKRIFEKFYRSEDYRTRETSGTGLGLYVVRKLAGKLGVTIDVTSSLNHGSTFGFLLPTKKEKVNLAAPKDSLTKPV